MPNLFEYVESVRSKNAGPFWLTVDIFCKDEDGFKSLSQLLATQSVAERLKLPLAEIKRFDIDSLAVIKLSFPRPDIQGTIRDRDMHGAAMAVLIKEMLEETEI